jgi:hypothetical protein
MTAPRCQTRTHPSRVGVLRHTIAMPGAGADLQSFNLLGASPACWSLLSGERRRSSHNALHSRSESSRITRYATDKRPTTSRTSSTSSVGGVEELWRLVHSRLVHQEDLAAEPCPKRRGRPASASESPATPSGIPSPRTCSNADTLSALYRSSSAIATFRRP